MIYPNIYKAIFLSRSNRFIAEVLINNKTETVHVKNTGRCRELLIPGCTVYLCHSENMNRKTKYDLVAVEKKTENGILLVNIDSQIPNDIAGEWLPDSGFFSSDAVFTREFMYRKSRFDFYVKDHDRDAFIEVKGCTLENNGICSFPDAPTERGVKHINELITAVNEGFEAYLLFVIQMNGMRVIVPNDNTHPEFGDALRQASNSGVHILAVECEVAPNSITACRQIPVSLQLVK